MSLRSAVVGAGVVSERHLTGLDRNPRTDLVAICDLDEGRANEKALEHGIKAYTDLGEMLAEANLDWLHVCTPVATHVPLAIQAIEAGVPVLIEKPVAETVEEVEELVASGEVDYLVADSFTFKSLRPMLMPVVYNTVPLDGAYVIYSYFFEEYQRLVTVYDCHGPGPGFPDLTADEHLQEAIRYYQQKNLILAYKHAEMCVRKDPDNRRAWYMCRIILEIFYESSSRSDIPSMRLDPFLLPALKKAAKEYMRLSPGVREAEERYELIDRVYQRELEKISAFRRKYRKQ